MLALIEPDLAALGADVGFSDRRARAPEALHLGAGKLDAGLEGLADRIVEAGLAVVGDDLAAGRFLLRHRLSSTGRRGAWPNSTSARVSEPTVTIGERTSSRMLPSSDSAYFVGAGLGSRKSARCSGIEPVLVVQRRREVAREAGRLELRAELRRDVGRDRDAAVPAMRHEAERRPVLAGELDELRPHRMPLQADAREIGGRVLHADDVLAVA